MADVAIPDVKYARSGDGAIAYQVVGFGPLDIVFVRGTLADLLAAWDQPLFVDHVQGPARAPRPALRQTWQRALGSGAAGADLETRMDDIRAVMDAAGSERAVLWAGQEGSRIALLFAATYPERTSAVVLYDPTAPGLWAPDYPWAPNEEEWRRELRTVGERWGDRQYLSERIQRLAPSRAGDDEFVDWFVWYMRRSATPGRPWPSTGCRWRATSAMCCRPGFGHGPLHGHCRLDRQGGRARRQWLAQATQPPPRARAGRAGPVSRRGARHDR